MAVISRRTIHYAKVDLAVMPHDGCSSHIMVAMARCPLDVSRPGTFAKSGRKGWSVDDALRSTMRPPQPGEGCGPHGVRLTPLGRFATPVDELPQLWNVLRGIQSRRAAPADATPYSLSASDCADAPESPGGHRSWRNLTSWTERLTTTWYVEHANVYRSEDPRC